MRSACVCADAAGIAAMKAELARIVLHLHATMGGGMRLLRLLDGSKATKMHTYILLCGPVGISLVLRAGVADPARTAYIKLLLALQDIWAKRVFR